MLAICCIVATMAAEVDARAAEQTGMRVHDLVVSDSAEAAGLAAVDSIEFIGPDTASLTVPCDATLNNVSIAPDSGVTTLYEPCLMDTNTLIWENVSLKDVTSFSAVMGGSGVGGVWRTPQFVGNNTTNAAGDITVQFQYKNGRPLYMIAVTYSQSGADVVANVSKSVYQYDKSLGVTFSGFGTARTLTNTVNGNHLAICKLGCTLRDSADQVAVKTFELSNSDADESSYETTSTYDGCLMTTNTLVWRDTDLSKVTDFSAQMAGATGMAWNEVLPYCFETNSSGVISCQFQRVADSKLYSAFVSFQQDGSDVYARITRSVYQYYKALGTDLTGVGSSVSVSSTPSSSSLSLRMVVGKWNRPYRHWYGTRFPHCVTNVPTTVWQDVRLADVVKFSAWLGGSMAGSAWHVAGSYNQTTNANAGTITCQFQWYDGYTRCAIVEFKQVGDDVEARVTRTCYQYDPLGTDLSSKGTKVSCVDTVGGTGLAVRDLSCVRLRRTPHVVAFNGFDPNDTPELVLNDIDVLLAAGSRGASIMPQVVRRRGTVRAGCVAVTNSCVIASCGGLATLPGGVLRFVVTEGGVPTVTTAHADLSAGTSVVLASDLEFPDSLEGQPLKLVIGCGLGQDVLQNLALSFAGMLEGRYRGALSVDGDGDLVVTVRERRGSVMLIR